MIPEKWNKKSYKTFVDETLMNMADKEYKEFHSSIVLNSKYTMIGIRVPQMRALAKDIAKKTNIEDFLSCAQDRYYEEVMIQGLVISHIKDESSFYKYFKEQVKKIDNWALCDTFCSAIKIVEKNEEKYFKEMIKMSLSANEFTARVGLVTILDHFINEENLTKIFETLNKISSDKFYINMAEAWLVCEMFTKYPNETMKFLESNEMNAFTQNKSISKINDSYRVSEGDKKKVKKYRK